MKSLLFVLGLFVAGVAVAVEPVKIVVPFSPGGVTDASVRAIQPKLAEELNRPVVIEYKPGGGGDIAFSLVANQRSKELWLLLAASNIAVHNPEQTPSFDDADLQHIITVGNINSVVVASANGRIKSFNDFAKFNPKTPIQWASPGFGAPGHITGDLVRRATGKDINIIPYKGVNNYLPDFIAGRLDVAALASGFAMPYIRDGKFIPIAVTSRQRQPDLPDVPTLREKGIAVDDSQYSWMAILSNQSADPQDIKLVTAAMQRVLADPEVATQLKNLGYLVDSKPVVNEPQFLQRQRRNFKRLQNIVD